ncbi:circularly permutated Ras protein 1 isoform X2 [Latimeria chalumnae]|nr:PREDICTED: circularly permutated Ras protein 1-like isoform X2 [Latimeria chalumnae]XP_014341035.1 PREDICTED: circularly permutated Ras protein 1-like isoform X2 [Latimeria chalumnae]XP_014341036.1 PREDICTED: circularly permutated Ras protein 1-like isoform X2 [Latimeria chalumnae]|eukprot:XP_014341034.1 PREDICTED: circularly permutated Ras protein 1-like isoform X2 [Latimeria chalumnae]
MEFASGYIYVAPQSQDPSSKGPSGLQSTASSGTYDPVEGSSAPPVYDYAENFGGAFHNTSRVTYDLAGGSNVPHYDNRGPSCSELEANNHKNTSSNISCTYDSPQVYAGGAPGSQPLSAFSPGMKMEQPSPLNQPLPQPPLTQPFPDMPPPLPPRPQSLMPSYIDVLPSINSLQGLTPPPLPERTYLKPNPLKANVNVVLVNLDKLVDITNVTPEGVENVFCGKCLAAMSSFSHDVETTESTVWTCEFCGCSNTLHYQCNVSGIGNDSTFLQASAPDPSETPDDSLVIFCVDISGSMCVTPQVGTAEQAEGSYTTRLQAVEEAVMMSLHYLNKISPTKRVALITFNDQVTLYGDGLSTPQTLQGFELVDKDYLEAQGKQQPIPRCIADSIAALERQLYSLKESGATALGPAALVSVAMATQKPGSKVIICTDGKANTDLGNLEDIKENELYESSKNFYSQIADYAVQHGVIVSVLTIEGTDCRLPELGQMADRTGGKVNRVNPGALYGEFQSILEDDVIATNVKARFIVHTDLVFKYEGDPDHQVLRHVGNVTKDTSITLEFQCKDNMSQSLIQRRALPFQVQVSFTLPNGRHGHRILTQERPITSNSLLVEKNINVNVLQIHCTQLSARLAMEGRVEEARQEAFAQIELIRQVIHQTEDTEQEAIYDDWVNSMSVYGELYDPNQPSPSGGPIYETTASSRDKVLKALSDDMANVIYRLKNAKKKIFKKRKPLTV